MIKKIVYILLFISVHAFAQNTVLAPATYNGYQDTLKLLFKQLYSATSDAEKKVVNQKLLYVFEQALSMPDAYEFTFDSLTDIARLSSDDKVFKIYNWNLPHKDGTQEYFGFVHHKFVQVKKVGLFKKQTTETIQLYPLIDKSDEIKSPENAITDNKKWYGMLYYKVITEKAKKKTYYTLLGWDGNDNSSKKKIIDPLSFDDKGIPHFGGDVFEMPKKNPKRVIFEFGASCSMSIKYNEKKDKIVFDHLAPEQPQLEGQYQYYCSDMSYDGFAFKKGKWIYEEDVDVTNEKTHNDKFYKDPRSGKSPKGSDTFVPEKKKRNK